MTILQWPLRDYDIYFDAVFQCDYLGVSSKFKYTCFIYYIAVRYCESFRGYYIDLIKPH